MFIAKTMATDPDKENKDDVPGSNVVNPRSWKSVEEARQANVKMQLKILKKK